MLRAQPRICGLDHHPSCCCPGSHAYDSSELINEKRGISPQVAVRLSKVFGRSAASWLTQQAHYDLAQVRADRIKLKRLEFA